MASALQTALADASACLESEAGQTFLFGRKPFVAWPVKSPETQVGRLEGAADNVFYFEAVRATAPIFKRADRLTIQATSEVSVIALVKPASPTTGLFLFAIHPAR